MRRREAGVTLIEVLIAVTLLSMLSVGMVMAIRVGLMAYSKTGDKLMGNRRVAGAQRVLQQELEGLVPAYVQCGANQGSGTRAVLFQGLPGALSLVSTFSLQQSWRGQAEIVQLFVIPGEEGNGVRLVVNETPYNGPKGSTAMCAGLIPAPGAFVQMAQIASPIASPKSFVLADKLKLCRFDYYTPAPPYSNNAPTWQPSWNGKGWPLAIRIEMLPITADPSRLQPITITAPIRIRRDSDKNYVDGY